MNVLFNSDKLKRLIINLYELTGIRTNIFDTNGKDIQLLGNHTEFCRLMNGMPEGHRRCEQCDFRAVQMCRSTQKPYQYRCHAGLWEVILPIFDSGEIIAFMAFGQMLDKSPRELQWKYTVEALSWLEGDKSELKEAYEQLSQISDTRIQAYAEIIEAVTSYIQLEGMIRSTAFSDQQRLEFYIEQHYMEKLSLKRISDELGIGTTKLCALAKKINGGSSVTKLISDRRVEAAKVMLIKENLSVADIAERVGFNDYNYFTKVFRKTVGVTPSQYRRQSDKAY